MESSVVPLKCRQLEVVDGKEKRMGWRENESYHVKTKVKVKQKPYLGTLFSQLL